jgi:hypothetical protein
MAVALYSKKVFLKYTKKGKIVVPPHSFSHSKEIKLISSTSNGIYLSISSNISDNAYIRSY